MAVTGVIFCYEPPSKKNKAKGDIPSPSFSEKNITKQHFLDDEVDSRAYTSPEVLSAYQKPAKMSPKRWRKKLSFMFRAMLGGGVMGVFVLISPFLVTEINLKLHPPKVQKELPLSQIEIVNTVVDTRTFSKLLNEKYISLLKPVSKEYAILIPKIGVNSKVIPDVDPANKDEYEKALKKGAAQAKGTAYPDQAGTQYIFAHSTDYIWNITQFNAIFYLLKDMEKNDHVYLVYQGKLYAYIITDKKIVNADDTFYLKRNLNKNQLILQTCYPPGTTWKRLLVFAEPVKSLVGLGDILSYNVDK